MRTSDRKKGIDMKRNSLKTARALLLALASLLTLAACAAKPAAAPEEAPSQEQPATETPAETQETPAEQPEPAAEPVTETVVEVVEEAAAPETEEKSNSLGFTPKAMPESEEPETPKSKFGPLQFGEDYEVKRNGKYSRK